MYIGEWAFTNCNYGFSLAYISSKVECIGNYAFASSSFSLYCEAESKPSTWDAGWLGDNNNMTKIKWGITRFVQGQTDEGILYLIYNDTLSIFGYIGDSKDLVIPDEIEGFMVIEISSYAFSKLDISSVLYQTNW